MNLFLNMSVFVHIVELGSLNGAAAALNISPTMVGKHLKSLEDHLRTQLLNRTTRRIALTSSGAEYYQHCKKVLELIDEGEERIKNTQLTPYGPVTLSCPEILGIKRVLPFSLDYMQRFPDVQIHLSLADRLIDLMREDSDIAIRIGRPPESTDIIARPLSAYEIVACASPSYLKKQGYPRVPEDLFNHSCLSLNKTILDEWQPPHFKEKIRQSRLSSDSSEAIRLGAIAGMGVIIQSKIFLENDINQGLLVPILEDHPLPAREVNALYLRSKYRSARMNFILNALCAAFPPN
ncbi:LysR family transcriptional regulator [Tatumella sp. TA1]|nr:LysR family transcriptional regulator [Tatumella sp. TA1]